MTNRTGEKTGWIGGLLGLFIWVAALAVVFLVQNKWGPALWGLILTGAAVLSIFFLVPWRFPETQYWKLLLIPYGLFFSAIFWAIWAFDGFGSEEMNWWILTPALTVLTPLMVMGSRIWGKSLTPPVADTAGESGPGQ